ncbi:MAG: hypothetical protein E6261_04570 [Cutibacterium avidum]|nr:hypothetical protein [Cutibacterium avidum]
MRWIPLDQLDDMIVALAALITAAGALIGAIVQGAKTRTEIGSLHRKVQREMDPDHGSSLRDAVNRIEAAQGDNARTMRGMARDIGRLADSDQRIQASADHAHESLGKRIERIEDTMFHHTQETR